jgi:glycosyltransferase involved in cell wall biosynthesis
MLLTFTVKPVVYGSLAGALARIPRRFAFITGLGHAFIADGVKASLLNAAVSRMYRASLRLNEAVFFQNQDDVGEFRRLNILSKRGRVVMVSGSGVDLSAFSVAPLPDGPPVFLLAGRLLREKGVLEFVEAAGLLRARYPEVRFQLLGPIDSNPSSVTRRQLDDWHSRGDVAYLGETFDVRPYLASASVFVLPSYREGTPRGTLEAMAMGRPIVTTDVPGCRETVREGENGFLVPARDARALAVGMERFLTDPALISQMGHASRQLVERKFDAVNVTRAIFHALDLALPPG